MTPNILLITADQWRGDCLGAAGHPLLRTPAIDSLAAAGVCFLRHYAQAAPCSPGRASLYTGLYQMNHRVLRNGTPLDARHDNIAKALARRGYRPTLFGYTDQAVDPRTTTPDDPRLTTYEEVLPGFEVAVKLPEDNGAWIAWMQSRGHRMPAEPWALHYPEGGRPELPTTAPPRFDQDETETAFLTGAFLDWLGDRPKDAPWCAHLSFLRPHPPFVVPAPFNELYDPAERSRVPARRGPGRRGRAASLSALLARHCPGRVVLPGLGRRAPRGRLAGGGLPGGAGHLLGDDLGGRSADRPPRRGPESRRGLGRHRHRADLGPRRDDGRPLDPGKVRLLRPGLSCAVDRPRPAVSAGLRRPRDGLHRSGRRGADAAGGRRCMPGGAG
jgi:hypothetical protein